MPTRSATLRSIVGNAACVGVETVRRCGCAGREAMQSPESAAPPQAFKSAAAGFFSRMATLFSRAFVFWACRSAIAAISGVIARLADVPVREVDAVWRLPELVLLRLWLGCEPELDSPCDSPEERDEVLAVCVVPVPCASPPDDV